MKGGKSGVGEYIMCLCTITNNGGQRQQEGEAGWGDKRSRDVDVSGGRTTGVAMADDATRSLREAVYGGQRRTHLRRERAVVRSVT